VLIKLIPDAISRVWGQLVPHIERSLPKDERDEQSLSRVLEGLLREQLSLWMSYDSLDNNRPNALVVLSPMADALSGHRNLNVLAITRIAEMDQETTERMYREGMIALGKYMQANEYKKIYGHISLKNRHLVRVARSLGFDTRYQVMFGG